MCNLISQQGGGEDLKIDDMDGEEETLVLWKGVESKKKKVRKKGRRRR